MVKIAGQVKRFDMSIGYEAVEIQKNVTWVTAAKQRKMNNLSTIQAMLFMVCNLPMNQFSHLLESISIIFMPIYA